MKNDTNFNREKRLFMHDELSHWHKKRRSFTLLQGVILCRSIEFWANISPWVRFLYLNLRSAVNKCITCSTNVAKEKKNIKYLISELAATKNLDNYELKEKFVQSKIAKETYKCKHQVFINKPMRSKLKLIHKVLANPDKFSL